MLKIIFDDNAKYYKPTVISTETARIHECKKRKCTALWACPPVEWPLLGEQYRLEQWNRRKGYIMFLASLFQEEEGRNLLGDPIVISQRSTIREHLWAQHEKAVSRPSPRALRCEKRAEKNSSGGGGGRRIHPASNISVLAIDRVIYIITRFL